MIKSILIIIILMIGSSCARHLRIYSKGCNMQAVWHDSGVNDFEFNHRIYSNTMNFEATRVNIVEILKNRNVICQEVESLSVETSQSAFDVITGFIPFLSRTTLKVKGTYKRSEKEAVKVDSFHNQREEFKTKFLKMQKKLRQE